MLAPQRAGRHTSKSVTPLRETRGTERIRTREPKRMIFASATVVFALMFTSIGIWLMSLATVGGPVLVSNSWWMLTWGAKDITTGDLVLMSASPPPTSAVDKWLMSSETTWVGRVVENSDIDGAVFVECANGDCPGNASVVEVPLVMVHGTVSPIWGGAS